MLWYGVIACEWSSRVCTVWSGRASDVDPDGPHRAEYNHVSIYGVILQI